MTQAAGHAYDPPARCDRSQAAPAQDPINGSVGAGEWDERTRRSKRRNGGNLGHTSSSLGATSLLGATSAKRTETPSCCRLKYSKICYDARTWSSRRRALSVRARRQRGGSWCSGIDSLARTVPLAGSARVRFEGLVPQRTPPDREAVVPMAPPKKGPPPSMAGPVPSGCPLVGGLAAPPGQCMATIGFANEMSPVEPKKPASPKAKMPPSDATSQ
jgi:hypothetical protein